VDSAPGAAASGAAAASSAASGAAAAFAEASAVGLPQCAAVAAAGASFLVAWEAKKGLGQWSGVYGDTLYNRYHAAYCGAHALWPFCFHGTRAAQSRLPPPPPRGVHCPAAAWQLAGYAQPASERDDAAPAAAVDDGEAE
jgi:hypothetical protein